MRNCGTARDCFSSDLCLLPSGASRCRLPPGITSKSRYRRYRLEIAVFATVKTVLFDLLLALWRHGDPMLKSRLPMQIAVLNDLVHLQEACAIRRGWFHFISLIHPER